MSIVDCAWDTRIMGGEERARIARIARIAAQQKEKEGQIRG